MLVISVLLSGLSAPAHALDGAGTLALTPHAPILINGDGGFTPANGVVAGDGTAGNPYIIEGWDINASAASASSGIEIQYTRASFVVRDVSVHSGGAAHHGLRLVGVKGGRFENFALTDNSIGMDISESWNVVVKGASFSRNSFGLRLESSWGITLQSNTFDSGGVFISGSNATHFDSHTISPDNRVAGKPILYYSHCQGLNLDGTSLAQLILAGCTSVRVAHLRMSNVTYALVMSFVTGATVEENNISYVSTGIYLRSTIGANISGNRLWGVSTPLQADSSSSIVVERNVVGNLGGGLFFFGGRDLVVRNNSLSGTGFSGPALSISSFTNVLILSNNLSDNPLGGVWISIVQNLTVRGNALWNDGMDVVMDGVTHGLLVGNTIARGQRGVVPSNSYDLLIHHNNFLANQRQASSYLSSYVRWDNGYPSGGNYWSDYSGVDECSGYDQRTCTGPDGIGDTARLVLGIQDRYPLMEPYVYANHPPSATLTLSGTRGQLGWFTSPATVTLRGMDDLSGVASIAYRVDGGTAQSYGGPFVLGDGVHALDYWAVDAAGNVETVERATVRVDTSGPVLHILAPRGVLTQSQVTISWEASDSPSGVDQYEISVDGGALQPMGLNTSRTLRLGDGVHSVRVRAIDAAGNPTEDVVNFRVDTNVFSSTGPYHGLPLYVPIVIGVGFAVFMLLRRRRR